MEKQVLDFVVARTHELIEAFSCSPETKSAALAWLDAVGTASEADETRKYIAELEADIMPIDQLIAFAQSEGAAAVFGDKAPEVAVHAKEIKAAGAAFCDCPACKACEEILARKTEIIG